MPHWQAFTKFGGGGGGGGGGEGGESHLGEDASEEHLQSGLLQALIEGHEAQVLRQVLEQDLDEDAAAGCGVLLSQPNAR